MMLTAYRVAALHLAGLRHASFKTTKLQKLFHNTHKNPRFSATMQKNEVYPYIQRTETAISEMAVSVLLQRYEIVITIKQIEC